MKIETKFDIGQIVYRIDECFEEVRECTIRQIRIENPRYITYFSRTDARFGYCESELFATREEAEQKSKEIGEEV